jgi:ABC-type lipoprotein export system ATPase subunit
VILCDEPTGDLDYENTINFIQLMQAMIEEKPDLTTIIVSHNDDVISMGKIKYRLKGGQLHDARA